MPDDNIEQPPPPSIISCFTAKVEGDKVRLTWYLSAPVNKIEITGVGEVGAAGSILVDPQESYTLQFDGKDILTVFVNLPEEPKAMAASEEPTEDMSKDENIEKIPCGDGFLIVDGREVYEGDMVHAADGPGKCPSCGADAGPWHPPIDNPKYKERLDSTMKKYGMQEDAAHKQILGETGGFVHQCKDCHTDYFVPANVAKVKDSQITTGNT